MKLTTTIATEDGDRTRASSLVVDDVSVEFGGIAALQDVTFEISADHDGVVGLIGPNGAGKSTLFNAISGLYPPTAGDISFAGCPITRLRPETIMRMGVTRTFQGVILASGLNVAENVLLGTHARSLRGRDALAAVERAIDRVGLSGYEHRFPGSLTYGERKRVELARVLLTEPRLLMLDEPFAGLSSVESQVLHDLIADVGTDGVQVMLVEHDMNVVMSVCTRILVLNSGALIADGTPSEIRSDPHVIEAYLGAQ